MSAHLNEDQIAECVASVIAEPVEHHLGEGPACRAAVDEFRLAIAAYRDAAHAAAERAPLPRTAAPRRLRPLRPVLALAACALLTLLVLYRPSPPSRPPVTDAADDALLAEIHADVNRSYPEALAPAALILDARDSALSGSSQPTETAPQP